MKTIMTNAETAVHNWYVVDAAEKTLGRLASELAKRLRGKHKPEYTPHCDTGDYMVVVNVDKIRVTGNKSKGKVYYRHTGFPGGIKQMTFEQMQERQPTRVLELAVKGMLPRGPLGRAMFKKLKVYAGKEHQHAAQKPEPIDI
ncbi:MAG: 50S ribosomal protein L13 [Coxiellaceae bacterium]|nr:50S ribosomal protein L13 [Coxiellaceae bacterium]